MDIPKFNKTFSAKKEEVVSKTQLGFALRNELWQVTLQTQVWHHQTKHPILHNDLGDCYDSLIGTIDKLVETIQGAYDTVLDPLVLKEFKAIVPNEDIKMFYSSLVSFLKEERPNYCSNIQNQIDEISDIIHKLLYKLSLNKC